MTLGRGPGSGLRRLWYDVRSVARAGRTLWRLARSRERVDVGLGSFSAAAPRVTPGQPQRYAISIASARGQTCDLDVRFDVYASDSPRRQEGHYASVTKRVAVDPRSLCRIEVHYDWLTTARLVVDGEACAPDASWRGTVRLAPRCSVQAAIYDEGGRELDRLTVYQEVAG